MKTFHFARKILLWAVCVGVSMIGMGEVLAAHLGVSVSDLDGAYQNSFIIEANPDLDALSVDVSALFERSQLGRPSADVNVQYQLTLTEGGDGTGSVVASRRHSVVYNLSGVYSQVHHEPDLNLEARHHLMGTVQGKEANYVVSFATGNLGVFSPSKQAPMQPTPGVPFYRWTFQPTEQVPQIYFRVETGLSP